MTDRELWCIALGGVLFGLLLGLLFGGILSAAGFDNRLSRLVNECHPRGGEVTITRTAGELIFDCKKQEDSHD